MRTRDLLNSSSGMGSSFIKSIPHDVQGTHTKKVSPLVQLPSLDKKGDDMAGCNVMHPPRQDLVNENKAVEGVRSAQPTPDLQKSVSNFSCVAHLGRHERRERRRQISLVECQRTSTRLWQEERNAELRERNSFFGVGG